MRGIRVAARLPIRNFMLATAAFAMLAAYFFGSAVVSANPDHFAGDYFMYAKADAVNVTDARKGYEPACDTSNDKQADVSGSSNNFYGRIHSNADLAISGVGNIFHDTVSPTTELTFGANDNAPPPSSPDCQLQQDSGNTFSGGTALNITVDADPASVHGPYQIGTGAWPGNLGDHLNVDAQTFTTIEQALDTDAVCDVGSLAGTTTITITETATYENRVVCNGTGNIEIGDSGFGTMAAPFRITMISHGLIKVSGSDQFLVPASQGHGVLAFTDMPYSANPTAIEIGGSSVNVPNRAILFSPRSGQQVSGSVNSTLCLQMIGQGSLKANGSSAHFGPLAPGCGVPAEVVTQVHANLGAGQEHFNLGGGLSAVEAGTEIHDRAVVTSHTTPPSDLGGSITASRYDNGTCAGVAAETATFLPGTDFTVGPVVTLDDILPFTPAVGVYSYRVNYGGDSNENMSSVGSCEGPVHVVDASVSISPASAANEVGDDHDLTVTVTVQGGSIATGGASVTATKESGPGVLDPGTCSTPAGASPQTCDVTLTSNVAGTSVVSASASIPIDVNADGIADVTITRGTGTTALTGAAAKTWVAVRLSITPADEANEVGSDHVLTITLEQSVADGVWTGLAGECVTAGLTNDDGATAAFVDTDLVNPDCDAGPPANDTTEGNACTTAADGTCTVTISSLTAGTTSVDASWAGGTVEGATVGAKSTDPDASKTWVAVRLSITPADEANEVGSDHVLTITLEQSVADGVWTGLAGECVTAGLTNDDGATAAFVDTDLVNPDCDAGPPANDTTEGNACTTAADGTCTVTISSLTAGTTAINASWAGGTVEGATVGAKSTDPDASKTWVAVRLSITPADEANEVGSDHVLTITLEQSVADGVWTGLAGECVTAGLTNDDGATAAFVDTDLVNPDCDAGPPANDTTEGNACTTAADGTCTVTISSLTAGTTSVDASWAGGTVEGATVGAKSTDPDASKTWVAVRLSITPADEANEVGSDHVLTITLEQSVADGVWTGLAGECVTAGLTNDDGATAAFVDTDLVNPDCDAGPPANDTTEGNACTTAADGTCTVTISSLTAGTTAINASWAGGTVEGATVGAKSTDPDASKTWVAVRLSITPADEANEVGSDHVLTITLEQSVADGVWTGLAGECVTAGLTNDDGATAAFVDTDLAATTCTTGIDGTCTVTINSPTAGDTTVDASWAGGTVAGATVASKATDPDALKHWVAVGSTLLIIDEDSLDNGIHFNASGGGITPKGPDFFGISDVNDDRP